MHMKQSAVAPKKSHFLWSLLRPFSSIKRHLPNLMLISKIYCSDIHFLRDIQNNQHQGKCHQPSQRPRLQITVTGNLILDIAKLNLIIGFLYTVLKKIMTNTPSQGSKLTLSLDIMHCARNLQISQLFACR